jgi:hypothetical protein
MGIKILGYDPQVRAGQRVVLTRLASVTGSMRLVRGCATCAALQEGRHCHRKSTRSVFCSFPLNMAVDRVRLGK